MSDSPDPRIVREIARTAVQRLATDSVRGRLVETAMAIHGVSYGDVNEWHAIYNAAVDAMGSATVTVSWPDERDARIAELERELRSPRGTPLNPSQRYALRADDLLALLADTKQLCAQGPEYGIRADFIDTTSAEFTVAETLDEALEALDEFDAKYGHRVLSRELVKRPVGSWEKVDNRG